MSTVFTYLQPSPALAGLVAFHYVLRVGEAGFDETLCALLGQVQVGRGGEAAYHFAEGLVAAPTESLISPTDRAVRMSAPPGFVGIGSGLTPAGWSLLAGRDRAPNTIVPLGGPAGLATLADADSDGPAALDTWLGRAFAGREPDPRIAAIDAWAVSDDCADVSSLSRALGLSRRSLERLTLRTHGATPKRLSAKYRALKVAAALATGESDDWRELSAAEHFADQAHFIREFRRFVGVTPGAFVANEDGFTRRLIRGRWTPGKPIGIAIFG
jgi:AraC-like DNA-binding protein